jgi:hypothetical protein
MRLEPCCCCHLVAACVGWCVGMAVFLKTSENYPVTFANKTGLMGVGIRMWCWPYVIIVFYSVHIASNKQTLGTVQRSKRERKKKNITYFS